MADILELRSFLFLQIAWRGKPLLPTPAAFRQVDIIPTNEYPMGRKGYTLTRCWRDMKENHTAGMLLLDGDVAIDPIDFQFMYNAMREKPLEIHIGASKLWPKSTGYTQWVWAHRKIGTVYNEWQDYREDVDTASFCFTYLPSKLIEACISAGMEKWTFPNVDRKVFEIARNIILPIHVVPGCAPKHMNY